VSERGSASGENLDERVRVLNFVGVLLGVGIDTSHAGTLGSAGGTTLGGVDIVVETVEGTADDVGGDALGYKLQVVQFVDLTGTHGVVTEDAQSPGKRTGSLHKLFVQTLLAQLVELLVGEDLAGDFLCDLSEGFLVLNNLLADRHIGLRGARVGSNLIFVVLDDSVVGNDGQFTVLRSRATEEERAHDEHVPLDASVSLDDSCVEEGNEEESGQESDSSASAHGNTSDKGARLLVEAEVRRALVDDGKSADRACDQEPEWCSPDRPRDGILAQVNDELDQ
jgi:hypothetical protein